LGSPGLLLGHDWLTYHNPEIDWWNWIIRFRNCPESCWFPHNDIPFPPHIRQLKTDLENSPEEKEADPMNPGDLPTYICPFTHLFNKKNYLNELNGTTKSTWLQMLQKKYCQRFITWHHWRGGTG
jgi:hypothetical protein